MKKTFALDEIDCANCALKLENAIAKVEGVTSVNINFFAQKMTLEAADDQFDAVLDAVVKLTKKLEPDCKIER